MCCVQVGKLVSLEDELRFIAQSVQHHELSLNVVGNPVQSHHHFLHTDIHLQPLISPGSPNTPLSWCRCPQGCVPASHDPLWAQSRLGVGLSCKGKELPTVVVQQLAAP